MAPPGREIENGLNDLLANDSSLYSRPAYSRSMVSHIGLSAHSSHGSHPGSEEFLDAPIQLSSHPLEDPSYHFSMEVLKHDVKAPSGFNKAMNRAAFVLGVVDLIAVVYLMGSFPLYMPHYYTIKLVPLIVVRLYTYSRKSWHYFLLDFCYWVRSCCRFETDFGE